MRGALDCSEGGTHRVPKWQDAAAPRQSSPGRPMDFAVLFKIPAGRPRLHQAEGI